MAILNLLQTLAQNILDYPFNVIYLPFFEKKAVPVVCKHMVTLKEKDRKIPKKEREKEKRRDFMTY